MTNEELKALIKELIQEALVTEMALTKERYTSKLRNFLIGAMKEFFKLRLAEKNMLFPDYQQGWEREISMLLGKALDTYEMPITGFSHRKQQFEVAKQRVQAEQASKRLEVRKIFKSYLKLNKLDDMSLQDLDTEDEDLFWAHVEEVFETQATLEDTVRS